MAKAHSKKIAAKLHGLAEDYHYAVQHGDRRDADDTLAQILKIVSELKQ